MMGWQYGLFFLVVIGLASSSIGTQKMSQEKKLIGSQDGALIESQNKTLRRSKRWVGTLIQVGSIAYGATTTGLRIGDYMTDGALTESQNKTLIRRKRFLGTLIQSISLVYGTTTAVLSIADYATDGAMYYPSIDIAKEEFKKSKDWIDSNKDFLKRLRDNYKETYVKYANTKFHIDVYRKVQSTVIKQLKHEAFNFRRNNYLNDQVHAKRFEEYGFQFIDEALNPTSPTRDIALFWTEVSANLVTQLYAATKLVENFRVRRIIKSQEQELKNVYEVIRSLKQLPKAVSTAPGKVSRIRRLGHFIKGKFKLRIPNAFRRSSSLRSQVDYVSEPPTDSFATNKLANSVAVVMFAVNIWGQVRSVQAAKEKKDYWDNQASVAKKLEEELKTLTIEWPEQMNIMKNLTDDMAGVLQYLLELDGITCDVNSGNVEKVAMLLKDTVVDTMKDGARYIERYKGIKGQIYSIGKWVSDVKVIYNELEYLGYGDMKNEIEHLLKQAGYSVGTWNDWQGFGQFIEKCGFSMRNMTRTCKTGNNCIGISEGVQIQEEYFDETELEKCQNETETQPMLNPPTTMTLDDASNATLLTLRSAFNASCNQEIIPFEYYTITNNDIGMVLAVNESNIEEVIIEEKNKKPDLNHNQMWRKEESTKDGYYLLVSKLYGRVLRVFDNTIKDTIFEWKWTDTKKIEGGSGFMSIDSNSCTAYKRDRNAIIFPTVEFNLNGNLCSQWDMKRIETDGLMITSPAPTTTSLAPSPSMEPPPRDIKEFLSRHNLQHLYSIFLQNAVTLNYLRKEELTREDMKDLGINSLPDRKKLTAAIGTL